MKVDRREILQWAGSIACVGAGSHILTAQEPRPGGEHKPIRIGQIGVGHGHASKLAVYRESPDYEVVGVVEPDPILRDRVASQAAFSGCQWMSEAELLASPGLQAVLVETEVRDLLTTADRCLAANKHIHLDKPAGASLPTLAALLQQAENKQLLVQLGYMYRYNPAIVLLRQLMDAGAMGEIFEVHAVMSKVVDQANRQKHAEFSGGMMFELGCHLIDLVIGLLGMPMTIASFSQHAATQPDGLADNMLAVFQYQRALASIKTSALEVEGFARRHIVVCGTKGTMHIQPLDDPSAKLTLEEPFGQYGRGAHELTFPKFARYVADAADMARMIRGEKMSDFSFAHDLAVQSAVLQAAGMSTH